MNELLKHQKHHYFYLKLDKFGALPKSDLKMKLVTLLFLLLGCYFSMASPFSKSKNDTIINTHNKDFVIHVKKAQSNFILDGIINEPDWEKAQKATNFHRVLPTDTGYAQQQSEVLMAFDDKAIFMAVTFYDTIQGKRVMESFRRDFSFPNNDNFLSFFDTFLDQTNGFSFGVSASGAKWDGIMYDGNNISTNWDCKWESKTKHYPNRWVTEMRIPFKSIRYPSGSQHWNANFSRLDLKSDEKSAWAPVPRQFPTSTLAYTGVLKFNEPLPKSKIQFSLIPYVFGSFVNDYEAGTGNEYHKDFGFDAKIGISSSMNLDLTYNPDFAQVEVDQQVTNIDRFELFFPEKRQFFLENSDLFTGFGFHTITPFFSRRIGLDAPVLGGARLSGKLGNDWRIGFMNMTTKETTEHLSRNFTVVSLQKKIFARSNVGLIFVNKEYLNQPKNSNLFNRVVGFDYNLASKNNFWNGKFFYHRSFQPNSPDKQYAEGFSIRYHRKNIQFRLAQTSVGENYKAEAGFIRRTGYNFIGPELTYLFVPNRKVVSHGINIENENYFNTDLNLIEQENSIAYEFQFKDRSELSFGVNDIFIELQHDFDPTHQGNHFLQQGSSYNFQHVFVNYESTRKTLFNWEAKLVSGEFYNGDIKIVEGTLGYRYQPYMNLTLNFAYTDMDLPKPFERTKYWLIGPKLDLTFTDKIFLSTFVQYNEQVDNMNVNMRFQWRYQPVSDIFLVYTDNYFPNSWKSRNRAIVLKVTYWLN